MKRTNQRFNKRVIVRECGTDEERLLYLEKLNMILMRNSVVQEVINKELRGKHVTTAKKLLNVHAQVKQLTENNQMAKLYGSDNYEELSSHVEALSIKLDALEEILEDLV